MHSEKPFPQPFIHLYKMFSEFYMYDVNTDRIIKLPENVFNYLSGDNNHPISESTLRYVRMLKDDGLLKSKTIKEILHPATDLLASYYETKLRRITLQLTQQCNMRCGYCIYSGNYEQREHGQKKMELKTALTALEYLLRHSSEAESLQLGFYGGEPLLEYELIKKCVEYMEDNAANRVITYHMTTNLTILNEDILHFCIQKNFEILVSFDGPQYIHDKHRKFVNGVGSFETVIRNLNQIKKINANYYKKNVSINIVLDPTNGFVEIDRYFNKNAIFKDISIMYSVIQDDYSNNKLEYADKFRTEYKYAIFKHILYKLDWLRDYEGSKLLEFHLQTIVNSREGKELGTRTEIPDAMQHSGICPPGLSRMLISVDGNMYPCERVSELSENSIIGNVYSGIDIKKAQGLMNLEIKKPEDCKTCWACTCCTACLVVLDSIDKVDHPNNKVESICASIRASTDDIFKDYCFLEKHDYFSKSHIV